jgi:hypothetical protein
VGSRISLDDVETRKILPLPGLKFQPLDHPTQSQPLFRLHYPGSPQSSGSMIIQNVGIHLQDYMESQIIRVQLTITTMKTSEFTVGYLAQLWFYNKLDPYLSWWWNWIM